MLSAVIDHLWQSTLFAGGVGILASVLRHNRASVRFWLWLSASLKFLVPFALLAALGAQVPGQPANFGTVTVTPQVLSTAIDSVIAPMSATGFAVGIVPAASPAHLWLNFLELVWLCGFLVIAGYWLAGWRQIRGARANSRPLAIDFLIPVRTSTVMLEPAVAGIVRPVLLLPNGIEGWLSPQQLRAVLAHEQSHVQRRDNLTAALHMVVKALFWFHPLVWWIETRLITERERACDEAVLAIGNTAEEYAAGILSVCQHYLESPLRCAAGVGGGDLTKRIEYILSRPKRVALSALQTAVLAGLASIVIAEPIITGHLAAPVAERHVTGSAIFRNYEAVIPETSPPSDGKDLVNAAATGNLAGVRSLLRKGVDVEFADGAYTPLTQAAQDGRDLVVQELLSGGAQIEHRRKGGDSALILAAGMGHFAVAKRLLDAGAQINDQSASGFTALMEASASGHQKIVLLLLSQGAEVNHVGAGETALLLAARNGHEDIVRLLLDFGADLSHRRFDGQTALDLAAEGRRAAVVEILLRRGAVSKP